MDTWKFFIAFLSLLDVIMAGYYAGFGFPVKYSLQKLLHCENFSEDCHWIRFDLFIEMFFILDIIVNFLTEYQTEENFHPIRDIIKIAENYIKGFFFIDLISCFPFILVTDTATWEDWMIDDYKYPTAAKMIHNGRSMKFNWAKQLWLLKWMRILNIIKIAEPRFFAKILKKINKSRLDRIIEQYKGK